MLLVLVSLFGVFRFNVDVALTIWALVGFAVVYLMFVFINYITMPRKQVIISTKVELSSPPRILRSVQNYRLKVSSEKHFEEKGISKSVRMDELIMSFNQKDHPDAYSYCLEVIGHHMEQCITSAENLHPDADVSGSPLLLPPEIKKLGIKD